MRRWVAIWVGLLMLLAIMPDGRAFAEAEDAPRWASRSSGTERDLLGIAHGGGRVVVVGKGGTALASANGEQWAAGSTGTNENLTAVAYGGGQFVAVGHSGTVLVSAEGAAWAGRSAPTTEHLNGVAYGAGAFVAVGDYGSILRSGDGLSWTVQPAVTDAKLYAVAYGAGTFVAVGHGGVILTSQNGSEWSSRDAGTDRYLTGVAYGTGGFVAVGERGTIVRSTDGLAWSASTVEVSGGLWRVAAGNDQFVGVGGAGRILSAATGTEWVLNAAEPALFLNDIAFINGQFLAVGDEGVIRTSSAQPLAPDSGGSAGGVQRPPQPVEAGEPVPGTRPEHVGCERGVVAGTRVELRVAGLLIQADNAVKQEDKWQTFCGNVSLNSVLMLDGALKVNSEDVLVQGQGHVYVETGLERYHGQISLFDGQFELSGDLTDLIKQHGLNHLQVAGLPVEITLLKLVNGGVQVGGKILLPTSLGGVTVAIDNLEIVGGEINVKGEVKLPNLKLGSSDLGLEKASVWFDSKEDRFGGQGTLIIPKMFDITGTIGFKQARLEKVGFGMSGLGLAIDTSGVFIDSLYGEAAGLTDPSAMKLTASTTIYGGPMVLGNTAVKGEDLTLTVDLSGKVSGSGKLVLLEFLETANGSFEVSYADGFKAELQISIVDVITANMELRVGPREFYGLADASLSVPRAVWPGGLALSGARLQVDTAGISGEVRLPAYTVSLTYPWRSKPQWGVKYRGLFSHKVRYLASTNLPAAPAATGLDMPAGMEEAVVVLQWDSGDADFTLKTPDGRTITPAVAPQTSETMRFLKDAEKRFALYWLKQPAPGTWTYIVNTNGATSYTVELMELTPAPRLSFTGPAADMTASGTVPITWSASAPAGSKVTLFYTKSPDDPGTLIAEDLDAAAGSYRWNTAGVPSGTYYIQGFLSDGTSARVRVTAAGKVRVNNPDTPPVPQGLSARAANGGLTLSWSPVTAPDLSGYRIHLAGPGEGSLAVGRQTEFTWKGLQPGQIYQVSVSAYDAEGLESAPSAPVTVFVPVPAPPSLRVQWPAHRLTNQTQLTVSGQVEAGATAAIYQDGKAVFQGLSGAFSRPVTLHRGTNHLRVVATKPNGDSVESETEYFLDTTPPKLTVLTLPEGMSVASAHMVLAGHLEPGARLTLNGEEIPVDPGGTYIFPLFMEKGTFPVNLVATDEAGNQSAFRGAITFTGSSCGRLFSDVQALFFDCEAVEMLASRNVIAGYPDGTFRGNRPVTRAEFAKMLVAALDRPVDPGAPAPFADARGHWAQGHIKSAVDLQAISGFPDGSFRPNDPVTVGQVIKIVAAAAGLEPGGTPTYADVQAADWFAGWVATAEQARLIGNFAEHPVFAGAKLEGNTNATRSEAAMILANLLQRGR